MTTPQPHEARVDMGAVTVGALFSMPSDARGVVVFAHGTGSGRHSPRNNAVAQVLQGAGLATLLIDLLSEEEERIDLRTGSLRFDIGFLAERLDAATRWLVERAEAQSLPVGYFGASTGAAAALVAAARHPEDVGAVVSRGGRPDMAAEALPEVRAPTLLIVGGLDTAVLEMNREALEQLRCPKDLRVVPGASHLFEEPGTLERVSELAKEWFVQHLA